MTRTRSVEMVKETPGPARRIGLRVAVILALAFLASFLVLFPPLLVMPVTGWLPDETFDRFVRLFVDEGGVAIHRLHAVGISLIFWIGIIGLTTQLRRPERSQAPLWAAVVVIVVATILDATIGVFDPFVLVLVALVLTVLVLHPDRLPEDRPALVGPGRRIALFTAGAAILYAYDQVQAQTMGLAEDPHVMAGHFASMAALSVALGITALIGASNLRGQRLTAWVTGTMTALLGAFFIGFPDYASSPGRGWGTVALILGAVYLLFTLRPRTRSESVDVGMEAI